MGNSGLQQMVSKHLAMLKEANRTEKSRDYFVVQKYPGQSSLVRNRLDKAPVVAPLLSGSPKPADKNSVREAPSTRQPEISDSNKKVDEKLETSDEDGRKVRINTWAVYGVNGGGTASVSEMTAKQFRNPPVTLNETTGSLGDPERRHKEEVKAAFDKLDKKLDIGEVVENDKPLKIIWDNKSAVGDEGKTQPVEDNGDPPNIGKLNNYSAENYNNNSGGAMPNNNASDNTPDSPGELTISRVEQTSGSGATPSIVVANKEINPLVEGPGIGDFLNHNNPDVNNPSGTNPTAAPTSAEPVLPGQASPQPPSSPIQANESMPTDATLTPQQEPVGPVTDPFSGAGTNFNAAATEGSALPLNNELMPGEPFTTAEGMSNQHVTGVEVQQPPAMDLSTESVGDFESLPGQTVASGEPPLANPEQPNPAVPQPIVNQAEAVAGSNQTEITPEQPLNLNESQQTTDSRPRGWLFRLFGGAPSSSSDPKANNYNNLKKAPRINDLADTSVFADAGHKPPEDTSGAF